jgi:toxin ParE1/3/4
MAYRVRLLPRAESDLQTLFQYITERAPLRGVEWFNALEEAIGSLCNNPERCPVVASLSTQAHAVRQLLYGRKPHVYKVYFQIVGDTVDVLHIRHGARRPPTRLEVGEDL